MTVTATTGAAAAPDMLPGLLSPGEGDVSAEGVSNTADGHPRGLLLVHSHGYISGE